MTRRAREPAAPAGRKRGTPKRPEAAAIFDAAWARATNGVTLRKGIVVPAEFFHVVKTHPGRWSAAAVAASLCLPTNARNGCAEWADLLDALDDAIRAMI